MKKTCVYDFDKMDEINELLGLDLQYIDCRGYVDFNSEGDLKDRDVYFDWMIIQMLDELPDEAVKNIVMRTFCVQYNINSVWETIEGNVVAGYIAAYSHKEAIEPATSLLIEIDYEIDLEKVKWRVAEVIDGKLQDWVYV